MIVTISRTIANKFLKCPVKALKINKIPDLYVRTSFHHQTNPENRLQFSRMDIRRLEVWKCSQTHFQIIDSDVDSDPFQHFKCYLLTSKKLDTFLVTLSLLNRYIPHVLQVLKDENFTTQRLHLRLYDNIGVVCVIFQQYKPCNLHTWKYSFARLTILSVQLCVAPFEHSTPQ